MVDRLGLVRAKIEVVDGDLFDVVAKRLGLMPEVVDAKLERGIPAFVLAQHLAKVEAGRLMAVERGISADLGGALMGLLAHSGACDQQRVMGGPPVPSLEEINRMLLLPPSI